MIINRLNRLDILSFLLNANDNIIKCHDALCVQQKIEEWKNDHK